MLKRVFSRLLRRNQVRVLAALLRASKHCIAYTGAGISTAAGIHDYASKGSGVGASAKTSKNAAPVTDWRDASPTTAHRAMVALHDVGLVHHWINQNHDSLPQKAGFPQAALNEIHGSLHDPSNPIVPYQGELRADLYSWMQVPIEGYVGYIASLARVPLCARARTARTGDGASSHWPSPSHLAWSRRQLYIARGHRHHPRCCTTPP